MRGTGGDDEVANEAKNLIKSTRKSWSNYVSVGPWSPSFAALSFSKYSSSLRSVSMA